MKPLFVPLYTGPWRRFANGSKTVEIRQLKGQWNTKNVYTGRPVTLSRGYSTPDRLYRVIGWVVVVGRLWELPDWAINGAWPSTNETRFFDPSLPLIAFECLTHLDAARGALRDR